MVKRVLNEILGSFNQQYEMADKVAENILQHLNDKEIVVDLSEYGNDLIKGCKISLTKSIYDEIKGSFLGLTEQNEVIINVVIGAKIHKENLASVIAHEMMHCYISVSRYNKGLEFDDTPETYHKINYVLNNSKGMDYVLALILYSTYYQEVNALVSQVTSNLKYIFSVNGEEINTETIKKYLPYTESYRRYTEILYEYIPSIEGMSDESKEKMINKFKNYYEINFGNIKNFNLLIKRCNEQTKKALTKIYRNACYLINNHYT